MTKGSLQQENIATVNIYAPNIGGPKYIKQILTGIKGEIDGDTLKVDVNTPRTSMDRSSKQKINKAIEILDDTIEQLDLIDIFRTLYPKKPEYTSFFCRGLVYLYNFKDYYNKQHIIPAAMCLASQDRNLVWLKQHLKEMPAFGGIVHHHLCFVHF